MLRDTKATAPAVFAMLILSALLFAAATCRAEETPSSGSSEYLVLIDNESSTGACFLEINAQPLAADAAAAGLPHGGKTGAGDEWHFAVAPYLWFPGMHGTAIGPNGGLSFRASPGDLLSHFRFGLMGAAEASRKRLVLTGDLLWIRLGDDKSVPFPGLGASSASMKATEFFLTPKIGLRLVDQEKLKITASTGIRYWHLGQSLNFNPSSLGVNFTGSQNFVDPLVGGQIQTLLSQRVVVNFLGDVGGWGTGSQLEYQWAGMVGYRLNARWGLHAGYRYLYVDKNADRDVVFKATTAGVVLGIVIDLK